MADPKDDPAEDTGEGEEAVIDRSVRDALFSPIAPLTRDLIYDDPGAPTSNPAVLDFRESLEPWPEDVPVPEGVPLGLNDGLEISDRMDGEPALIAEAEVFEPGDAEFGSVAEASTLNDGQDIVEAWAEAAADDDDGPQEGSA